MMEDQIRKSYEFLENFEQWLQLQGLNTDLAQFSKVAISIIAILAAAIVANFIAKKIIVVTLVRIAKRTNTLWDDYLINHKVFHKLSHLAPALIIQFTIGIALYDYSPKVAHIFEVLTNVYIAIVAILVVSSFLDAAHDMYMSMPVSKNKPIKGYIQVVKILIYFFGGIITISILFGKDPSGLLLGLGTSAAILMLVFKDTILGLVASIQVSANNMIKLGDWIEMPSRNADGTVIEISLHTVKVQNWDRTITTIPTYSLVSESFVNWRGMEESNEGRRIKRSIFIDMKSVKFCTPEMLEKFKKVHYIKDYIEQRNSEIEAYNETNEVDTSILVNGRRMTNLGIFRKYMEQYIYHDPKINSDALSVVRYRQTTEMGMPVEIYCFSKEKSLVDYEGVIADIFDHVLSVVSYFELRIFQNPSGEDFQRIIPTNPID
jgi:miniconductance mechanosensitive channel